MKRLMVFALIACLPLIAAKRKPKVRPRAKAAVIVAAPVPVPVPAPTPAPPPQAPVTGSTVIRGVTIRGNVVIR